MKITLHSFTPDHMQRSHEQLVAIYAEAFRPKPYNKSTAEIKAFAHTLASATQRAGFQAVVAQVAAISQPVGFCYGYAVATDSYFYELVSKRLGDSAEKTQFAHSFQLVELAVLPHYQGRGIGGQLHDFLLADQPYQHAVLATLSAETTASTLYRSRGWQTLIPELAVPALSRVYQVMGLEIGVAK